LPQSSKAVHVRWMTSRIGLAGSLVGITLSEYSMKGSGSQTSVAVASPVALGSVASPQKTYPSDGQTMSGGVVSVQSASWSQAPAPSQ
jgi:hypothetical protein